MHRIITNFLAATTLAANVVTAATSKLRFSEKKPLVRLDDCQGPEWHAFYENVESYFNGGQVDPDIKPPTLSFDDPDACYFGVEENFRGRFSQF